MSSHTGVLPVVALTALMVLFIVLGLAEQGMLLKCRNRGQTFNAPFADREFLGLCWTLPYFGQVICPKGGDKRLRRNYYKIHTM